MLRFPLSVAAIFPLLFVNTVLPPGVSARRCPVKMPETLLSLYQNSDSIHVASFDKLEHGEVTEETEDYTSIEIKKHFTVSSTLKGEARKFVVLTDHDYRYKNASQLSEVAADDTPQTTDEAETSEEAEPDRAASSGEAESEEPEQDPESAVSLEPGDSLLLFLKNGDEESGPHLTDYRDGAKKLSIEHLGIYESRVRELNSIFEAKEVNRSSVIAWLIRCAEDPVTRWEATYELLRSVESLEWQTKAADERKEQVARGETVEDEANYAAARNATFQTGSTIFAEALDVNHKQSLSNLLLNLDSASGETKKSAKGDRELLDLVRRWGDQRLPDYLLNQLQNSGDVAYVNVQTMETLAAVLDDEQLTGLFEKYREIAWEDDSDEVADESESEGKTEEDTESDETPVTAVETEIVDVSEAVIEVESEPEQSEQPESVNDVEKAGADKPAKITYKDLRSATLAKFLKRTDVILAKRAAESNHNVRIGAGIVF